MASLLRQKLGDFRTYLRKRFLRRSRYLWNPEKFWNKQGAKDRFEEYPPDIQATHEAFLRQIDAELKPLSVLEVGCGYGRLLSLFGERGTGVDFGEVQIAEARRRGLRATITDAKALPFPNNSFDLVYTFGVLMHIPPHDIDRVRNELIRVSKKWILNCEATNVTPVMFGYDNAAWYRNPEAAKRVTVVRVWDTPFRTKDARKRYQVVLVEKINLINQ